MRKRRFMPELPQPLNFARDDILIDTPCWRERCHARDAGCEVAEVARPACCWRERKGKVSFTALFVEADALAFALGKAFQFIIDPRGVQPGLAVRMSRG
jgi:hypothetical protein